MTGLPSTVPPDGMVACHSRTPVVALYAFNPPLSEKKTRPALSRSVAVDVPPDTVMFHRLAPVVAFKARAYDRVVLAMTMPFAVSAGTFTAPPLANPAPQPKSNAQRRSPVRLSLRSNPPFLTLLPALKHPAGSV